MANQRLIRTDRAGDAAIPPALRRVRGHAAGHLLAHYALSPDEAVAYTPPGALHRWWLARQIGDGVVRQASGGLWIDLPAHARVAERRSRRAAAVAVPLAPAALALLFY